MREGVDPPTVSVLPVGPLQCNCIVFGDHKTKECVVVDPGGDPDAIVRRCGRGWHVRYILITHAHLDHILAAGEVKRRVEELSGKTTLIALHPEDRFMYDNLELQCRSFGVPLEQYLPAARRKDGTSYTLPAPEVELADDLELCLAEDDITCKGSCCFLLHHKPSQTQVLASGDTLFCGSVGRSDLPGGNGAQLSNSIQKKLYTLPDALRVVPGHGPFTTIKAEKDSNPFVRAKAKL